MTFEINIKDQNFILHCSGAVYWVQRRLLLISDAHLGKVSHFRKFGAAIPSGVIHKNFLKLDEVIAYFNPESICFLGDLFHSSLNLEWDLFSNWVSKTNLPIVLIAGNHDIINPKKYEALGIKTVSEWATEDGFLLTHHPETREGYFTFCGHIHPAVRLRGMGRQVLKLPCFFMSENQMILPAFGEFTGTHVMQPTEDNMVYVIVNDGVVKL
ncbi:ligase-associated DNA damage response endonuclease PdeM [Flavobacterium sp. Sd200]|uniref:ligase-associated DNA damage response endonuclease PdeM n=1 Tax=Flavobacterium sp. Sd200 TaxID=2692211 RepID=UPI00136BC212|nr:ligase-associated DNA damage response endonuclease PdeM [Flavobacterium sp. Sd200]MXN92388.1 ligase-associated DNA damage response endonuclease PdeM [Flavobacterium sp. Sd200]